MNITEWISGLIAGFQASQPAIRISISALGVATFSLLVSVAALWVLIVNSHRQKQGLKLSQNQEARRASNLQFECRRATSHVTDSMRSYDFEVAILNQSDSDISVRDAELTVRYFHQNKIMAFKVWALNSSQTPETGLRFLFTPVDIQGRRTVSGTIRLESNVATLEGKRIKDYTLRITDTFSKHADLDMDFVQERGPK